ncbi:MAG: 4a-hydroxytetrahydrobiopterin dehydratase [Granulosicoccaceae bacterium]
MKADKQQIDGFLASHGDWAVKEGKLYRFLRFDNFAAAFGFMTQIAIIAEKQDHHPDWSNSYRTVEICLTTHHYKGISQRDFDLAEAIDAIAGVG